MAVMIRTVGANKSTTVNYNQWINDIVLKGKAHEYEVMTTWDLVVVRKKIDGVFKNLEITEIENAKNLKQQSPLEYDYIAFNVNAQIKKDIKKSNQIKRWHFFFTVTKAIKYIIRQARKPFQNMVLLTWLMIALAIISILLIIFFNYN